MVKRRSHPPSVGAKVRRQRRLRELTLDGLARAAGISKSILSEIERNRTNPTIATLWRLANALGFSIAELLGGNEPKEFIERVVQYEIPKIASKDGKVQLRILGPLNLAAKVEWYELLAESGGY